MVALEQQIESDITTVESLISDVEEARKMKKKKWKKHDPNVKIEKNDLPNISDADIDLRIAQIDKIMNQNKDPTQYDDSDIMAIVHTDIYDDDLRLTGSKPEVSEANKDIAKEKEDLVFEKNYRKRKEQEL